MILLADATFISYRRLTLEAATDLLGPITWTPLLTTNVPAMPFDYVDFDVKLSDKPRKYYRVRQP